MATTTATAPPSDATPPTEEEAEMTRSFAQDRPTIDAAIKSYVSLACARALTASATDGASSADAAEWTETNTDAADADADADADAAPTIAEEPAAKTLIGLIPSSGLAAAAPGDHHPESAAGMQRPVLQLARIMLQTVNEYAFPIHCTVADAMTGKPNLTEGGRDRLFELSIASRLWNGLIQSKQKPSRFLGRKALKHAWRNRLGDEIRAELTRNARAPSSSDDADGDGGRGRQRHPLALQLRWLREFERLLYCDAAADGERRPRDDDDDSALLWAPDGGANELAKRRQRRQQAATQRGIE